MSAVDRNLAEDLALARDLAAMAGKVALTSFGDPWLRVDRERSGELVCEVDRTIANEIRVILRSERPDDGLLIEGSGQTGQRDARWIVDPIDGTDHYLARSTSWGVLIALEVGGVPCVGVVDAPALGRRWWAASGCGSFADGRRLQVAEPASLATARLTPRARRAVERLNPELTLHRGLTRVGDSSNVDLLWSSLLVAEGSADIDVCASAEPWDLAAPRVIVEGAGGRVTDIRGRPDADAPSAVSAAPLIHSELFDKRPARARAFA